MSEEISATPVVEAPSAPQPPAPPQGKKKRKKSHAVRNGVIAAVVVAALGAGGFFLWKFLGKTEEVNSQMQTRTADWGSIQSSVQGSGSARAKESTAITLNNTGIVQSVYITEGQMVNEGDPLYEIVSPAAQEDLASKQDSLRKAYERLDELQQELADAQKLYNETLADQAEANVNRFVKAPFSGQLQDTQRYQVDQHLGTETKIATLVDDSKFRIPFYFNYAYEGKVFVGQSASLTVNTSNLTGTVEEINMVRRVSPEGTLLFEAVVVVPNSGTLTKGLTASATLTAADGELIYPYDQGILDYYRTLDILTKTDGEVISTNLRDYADVREGEVLLTLSEQDFDDELERQLNAVTNAQESIRTHQDEVITNAQKAVDEAQKALDDFSAVAPMSGTITSCTLVEGQEVKSGDTVITISNNTTMVVTIQVDDRNIAYVKPGMGVDLQSSWGDGGSFYGVVTKIDMSLSGDAMGSGMTNYPVTLEVDNMDGTLLEGMWLQYSFVTSQSDNCILVPMQSVQHVPTEDGESASVVFIQADSKPDNAVELELPELMPGQTPTYPSEEEGFYAVPVVTGLSDNYNVEIKEGLEGGETVFVSYYVEQAWG